MEQPRDDREDSFNIYDSARHGHIQVTNLLLELGADPNSCLAVEEHEDDPDDDDDESHISSHALWTAATIAARRGDLFLPQLLASHGGLLKFEDLQQGKPCHPSRRKWAS